MIRQIQSLNQEIGFNVNSIERLILPLYTNRIQGQFNLEYESTLNP